ncbi:MAG: elongation factor Ts [Candidatus Margulisiibacteriota bacterium]|nr:MAG: elongation factor Ts [Candidatus Margulisbacteria bacterium GWF2_38_17]OGI05823.1 MAG: elongation factor Ts [Candidatus Margulisbacteria bacterium GWE2_39_32]PZM77418.1 MAG: elongation factor Ts [Candidatus Margulisiibacteriota bacterium]HCY37553.1 elongation factor Ts [Candidatus Margulisiibacteriota bacterium]
MVITSSDVKELRDKTGAGMMDCKQALSEANGDMEKAGEILRTKGLAAASKRSGREVKNGVIESYIHMNGSIGVLVQLNCETDFVARNDNFRALAKDIAMHVAAANPLYLSIDDVPPEVVEKEKEILRTQVITEGKPEAMADKIVEGKIKKYFSDVCLLEQPFVKDQDKTVSELIKQSIGIIGENITLSRFARFSME